MEIEQITRENELKKWYKDTQENLLQAIDQLQVENMQLRRKKESIR